MNQDYKLKFEQMRDGVPGKEPVGPNDENYPNPGYNRNVAFVLPNGSCESFNYAYLVTLKYKLEFNEIDLVFTTDTVKIKGYGLWELYFELFDQRNRIIQCTDERYKELENEKVVTDITVTKNQ